MAKKPPKVKAAGSALDMLVRQFSQPLACLRELVQNAIDAGTNQVEVTLAHDTESGCLRLSVSDTGEGMTEHIIGTQLTRLFASSKEGDLTKVGKFGIGFVSVFALQPKAVVVDTGRQGENWRVLFKEDRSFELLRLPHGVEGTTVHLYLSRDQHKIDELREKVRETLTFWCRHCCVQITVDGKPIGADFALLDPVQVSYEESGTRLVLAVNAQAACFYGFYNQGLTLLEGTKSPIPHLSFKLDSRYLEHTLTRDNVIQNQDYAKGMALLDRVLKKVYPATLYEHLRSGAGCWELLGHLGRLGINSDDAPLYPDHQGQLYSLRQLRKCQVTYQTEEDELSRLAYDPAQHRLVLRLDEPALRWLRSQQVLLERTADCWGFSEAAEGLEDLLALCAKFASMRSVRAVRWRGKSPGELLYPASRLGLIAWSEGELKKPLLLLDVEHPDCESLQQLMQFSPLLAAQVLLQHLILRLPEGERPARAQALALAMLEQLA